MKIILRFVVFATIFVSCQREASFEINNPPVTTIAVFTFPGSPNACTGGTIAGYFASGSMLSSTNTVSIQVNVATAGTYVITTNTVNGYLFSATGIFTSTGVQTVILIGSGTPLAAQIDTFTPVVSGTTACSFNITVLTAAPAVYTLSGAPAACTVATVNGIYGVNTDLTSGNTVTVQVNVTTIGTYTLSTNTVGGMTFSKSGSFSTTGIQTVILNGTGTPTTASSHVFTLGTGGCTFTVTVSGPAVYTLSGAPGACTIATVNGSYSTGTALSGANTVTVQVNVTAIGVYTLSTNTVGGMTFSKSGTFTATGIQTVTLNGTGTPTTTGVNTVTVGASGCTFIVTVAGPAVYTLPGATGACTVATINGSYTTGTLLSASNTVSVQVNVTTIGSYTLSTNTVGGMTFSKSGSFSTTGLQAVTLNGTGMPTAAGANIFTAGASGCTFTITVIAGTAPTGIYSCKIDGVFKSFADLAEADITDDFYVPARPYLFLDGYFGPPSAGDSPRLQIFINKNNNSAITAGTYNGDNYLTTNGYRIEIGYHLLNPDLSTTIWNTSSTIIPPANPPFTIIITSITSTRVKGTFSGTLTNTLQGSTQTKVVTEGVFDLPIL